MKPLFLNPPTFDDFDGGAGARYQASREVTSFWYPTWLAQPAALGEGSRLIDAPPHKQTMADVLPLAKAYDLVLNGVELGSGSLRIPDAALQRAILRTLGMSEARIDESFGWFLEALEYGAAAVSERELPYRETA